jgi:hypothetical protein
MLLRSLFFLPFLCLPKALLYLFPDIRKRIKDFKERRENEFIIGVYVSARYENNQIALKTCSYIIETQLVSETDRSIFILTTSPKILKVLLDRYPNIIFNKNRFTEKGEKARHLTKLEAFKEYLADLYILLASNFVIFSTKPLFTRTMILLWRKLYNPNAPDIELFKKDFIPQLPAKLPGSLWGMTVFFNPVGYKNKLKNYHIFREKSKRQGLKLLAVELAFGEEPFELTSEDAEILIQLRGNENNILWQKERLLNIGLKSLPKDCDKIAWLDADIIFHNKNWIEETSRLLERYVIVQPYSSVVRLPKDVYDINVDIDTLPFGIIEGHRLHGIGYGISNFGYNALKYFLIQGHPGYAWAARRAVFDKYGFYDKIIAITAGDYAMASAFYGNHKKFIRLHFSSPKPITAYLRWVESIFKDIARSVYYTNGYIIHLWHGEHKDRSHGIRQFTNKDLDFDPAIDIKIDKNGCWAWATDKPIRKWIKEYFGERKEEGL